LTDIPLLLTCRSHLEGGFQEVSAESRIALYKGAIEEKLVDIVDIELISGYEEIKNLKTNCLTPWRLCSCLIS